MRIVGDVKVNLRNKYLKQLGQTAARDVMLDLALDTQTQAKINVSPGMGPGPHPHQVGSYHIDTGQLRDSIKVDVTETGDTVTATVSTDLLVGSWNLGALLELGWHAANGAFYRYEWLDPALRATVPAWQVRAARKMKVRLETP